MRPDLGPRRTAATGAFPLFLFWLWAIAFGGWVTASSTRQVEPVREHQPA